MAPHSLIQTCATQSGNLPTYTVVTTSSSPADVVALTLSEFSKTVMTGAVVSVVNVVVVDAHMDVADRQTVRVEHLQYQ